MRSKVQFLLLAALLLLLAPLRAGASDIRETARTEKAQAEQSLQKATAQLEKVRSFRRTLSLPHDATADAKAAEAEKKAEANVGRAQRHIARLETVLAHPSAAAALPLAGLVRGEVRIVTPAGDRLPFTEGSTLLEGESIATGKDGEVTLSFPDGSTIHLGPNARFTMRRGRGHLERGGVHIKTDPGSVRGERTYTTPTAVAAVRGTEFDLTVESDGETRLALQKGVVELRATGETKEGSAPWWRLPGEPSQDTVGFPVIGRVAGAAAVGQGDTAGRKAEAGTAIAAGEVVTVGDSSLVELLLPGKWRWVLGEKSVLAVSRRKDGGLDYRLHVGRVRGADPLGDGSPVRLAAGGASLFATAADFQAVMTDDQADWVVERGVIEVSAAGTQ